MEKEYVERQKQGGTKDAQKTERKNIIKRSGGTSERERERERSRREPDGGAGGSRSLRSASLPPCLPASLPPCLPASLPPCLPRFLPALLPCPFSYNVLQYLNGLLDEAPPCVPRSIPPRREERIPSSEEMQGSNPPPNALDAKQTNTQRVARGRSNRVTKVIRSLPYGRFSKVHVSKSFSDPGALNCCMHTFPEINYGCAMVSHMIPCVWIIWDLRPSI